jgi:hypothetical protein
MLLPQHDPPVHKHLLHSLVFGHAGEYFRIVHALTPLSFAPTYSNTTLVFFSLHLQSDGFLPFSLEHYKPNQNLELSLTFSNWHSNTNYIYLQVALLSWFSNTFEIVFTQKIIQVDSHSCLNFIPISHMVTCHVELHISLEWLAF